jgi:hypothetical protein
LFFRWGVFRIPRVSLAGNLAWCRGDFYGDRSVARLVRRPRLRHQNQTLEFTFHAEIWLPASRDRVFDFFCNAANLESLTPRWLRFEVLTPTPIKMRAGALIDYRIRIHGIPIRWMTEITQWNPPHSFEDVQLRGPYSLWQHTHTFEERDNGTACIDNVRYRPRGGALTNWLFVRRDIEQIFQYRKKQLVAIFDDSDVIV